jgi:hypothetical protein
MTIANGICSKALASGSIVLMARIVDGAGAPIRRSDVIAIEYSLYEIDPCWPEQYTVVRDHREVLLAARDLLFDSLQVGRLWSMDDVGYNFRHEFAVGFIPEFAEAGRRYEVAYQLTTADWRRTSVRFRFGSAVLGNPRPDPPLKGEGV